MSIKYSFAAILLTITATANADQRIVGHMTPLGVETLRPEIRLNCGMVIREKRGGSPLNISRLNKLCSHALSSFPAFIQQKGLRTNRNDSFKWSISFLPEARCYRCLNDLQYRFRYRFVKQEVIGYTDRNAAYTFMFNDARDREYTVTFVHETFHALSMFYGVYENHLGTLSQKTEADERLAREFTRNLGYGE